MKLYDTIIVGGGPAGLSAAIYLARFNRSVLVIDKLTGRSSYPQINENYLGFPKGVYARKLRTLGHKQAEAYGAEFMIDEIIDAKKEAVCMLTGKKGAYQSKSLILATGVHDLFPEFKHFKEYIGRSLFWCITCDGYKARNKRIVVVGKNDEAAVTCLQFLNFTDKLFFVTNCTELECGVSEKRNNDLRKNNIPVYYSSLVRVHGDNGMIDRVILEDGTEIEADFIFNQQGSRPNSFLAHTLGVKLSETGFIVIDTEQRTSIPGIYAAGDVTRYFSHQIVTAAHEGSMAAQAANYDLYRPEQREG